ncbi:hypothetical protein CDD81_3913 [Ophiocordyceps australis]|uniref:Transcription factor IIIC 90kDa subunit N-terminal domain-containing protein n=1 Tax=Ophiocordyceps australis TaxID=1399860 RepID=A0A2C5Y816_9HYPO|nr:hypothetical protein CDD81_3913 [Ophiocordyceps australis]
MDSSDQQRRLRPLERLQMRSRPLGPHNLAWSSDGELAVGLDDRIHIYAPDFALGRASVERGSSSPEEDEVRPQFWLTASFAACFRPDALINSKLCAAAGLVPVATSSEEACFGGVGSGPVTGAGAGLGQTVKVEWSPSGLGVNGRPVLMAQTTNGGLIVLGEGDDGEVGEQEGKGLGAAVTARTFAGWKVLWGVGAGMVMVDKGGMRRMEEKVVGFAWAKGVGVGRAVVAYGTDGGEVVVLGVEYGKVEGQEEARWKVFETARFKALGPHKATDAWDTDYVPGARSLSVGWSAWLVGEGTQTATLAYTAHNYLGLRRVVLKGWEVEVARTDSAGLCCTLGADAFVEWEDVIWRAGDGYTARGVLATPAVAKAFQVGLVGGTRRGVAAHWTAECGTTYASAGDACTNPITALVIHPPFYSSSSKPPPLQYSLIRLSATPSTTNWFQTTRPSPPLPQWASHINRQLERRLPRLDALQGLASDSDSESEAAPQSRVPANYYRCWGMAASPGGGCSAVLVSRHGTMYASRRASCRVLFSWAELGDGEARGSAQGLRSGRDLTTEGRLWEAVYGGGGRVEDVLGQRGEAAALRGVFEAVVQQQQCCLCRGRLAVAGAESVCEAGHSFG